MKRIFFTEEQKFGTPTLYITMGLVYLLPVSVFAYAFYCQFVLHIPFGNKPISDGGLIIMASLVLVVLIGSGYLLFGSRLKTIVSNDQLSITFKPLTFKSIVFHKSDIERFEIREYKPMKEYSGYGVKQGKGYGKAYNVSGKVGLQLYLKGNKKVLIGTQRGDAFLRAMKKMMGVI